MKFPAPVPQIPVRDLDGAIALYRTKLGFTLDWKYEEGIAGMSRDDARLFLDRFVTCQFHPVRVWLNLASTAEVDVLYREWQQAGVAIIAAPVQKPWGLYEFTAEDGDGNSYRVFHDVGTPKEQRHSDESA